MKRKEKYESPWMERTLVELEDGFCAASADVKNPNNANGKIKAHEVNTGFTTDFIGENKPGEGTNVWE